MACSQVKTENPDEVPEVKPESIALEDACDRALRKRKRVSVRIDPDLVGYWPDNRGGAGVTLRHIHEVAQDLMKNKIRLSRYDPVELFELPEPVLKSGMVLPQTHKTGVPTNYFFESSRSMRTY